jgi:hypothetical protein
MTDKRHAEIAGVPCRQDGIGLEQALVVARIGGGHGRPRLHRVTGEPRCRRHPGLERGDGRVACHRGGDELVALQQPHDGCVRIE